MKVALALLALAALAVLMVLMTAVGAEARCRNNRCLWHGHHHYYRHARLQQGGKEARDRVESRPAPTSRSGAERQSACSQAWEPSLQNWPGVWVRAGGFPPKEWWRL